MAENLPEELITEILTKLPVKPLLRFKCVSKPWNSLISSPKFINRHLKQTLITNPYPNILISHHSLISAVISTEINNNNNLCFSELNHPLKLLPNRPDVGLIESCNGVLLISDYGKKTIFLYNPGNNTYRLLPPIPTKSQHEYFGFGYDSHTDDYKVVRVFQTPRVCMEICVYTMRKNVWKLIKDDSVSMRNHFIQPGHAVAVNGMLHFIAVTKEFKPVIMCFDLRTESFLIVNYPELENYDFSKLNMSLRELQGCLCLLVNFQSKGVGGGDPFFDNRQLLYADVWEMRECGSWAKLFRIRKSEVVGKGKRCMQLRLVAYSKDKQSVLVEVDGVWFGWYDLVNKRVKRVKVHGLGVEASPYVAMTYVETLVSVSNDKAVSVSKGRTMPKEKINNIELGNFLSKGFKLRL